MKIRARSGPGISVSLAASLLLGASGCSSNASSSSGGKVEDSLEIFSWWTNAGEVEALDALINVYRSENKGVDVTNAAAADPTHAREALQKRLQSGDPPDSFQAISGVDVMTWVADGKMKPISDLSTKNGWD